MLGGVDLALFDLPGSLSVNCEVSKELPLSSFLAATSRMGAMPLKDRALLAEGSMNVFICASFNGLTFVA